MSRWRRGMTTVLKSGVFLVLSAGRLMALQVGDKAPDFSLPATTAEKLVLTYQLLSSVSAVTNSLRLRRFRSPVASA